MNEALNKLGSQLFGWFGQLSIELAALAVLVLVASLLLPIKSPALRHLLWAVVLLKPLVSIAVSSPYTLFTPFVYHPWNPLDTLAFSPVEHPTVQVAASPTIATSSVHLTTAGWGAILWIVGAALLIGRILIGYGIVWCLRQQAQIQHDGPLFDALQQARRTLDCYPKVEVAISPSISSPMALGILRPIIVFPTDLVEKLSADKLALILMHELAHVRRWDNLTRLLHRLVSAVLFFHPAVWLCGRMLRREAEQACDDLVVCATGHSEAYARGLAHVAERAVHLNPLIRRIPTMNAFAAESDLALRIRRTLGGGARRMGMRARVLTAVLLCPLAAVTLPSVSKISAESSQDERLFIVADQNGNMKLNDKPVTFATLKEELQAKRRDERLSIVVDQNGNMKLNDKSVTFATLKEELQAKRRLLDNTTMIVIQSDGHTPHGQIVQIMYVARQVGLVDMVVCDTTPEVANVATALSRNDDNLTTENPFIVVDQHGNIKLNDKSVTFAELKERLRTKRRLLDNTTMIIIQGDERAPHGMIAGIMDIARQVGLVDQVVATKPQPEVTKVAVEPSRNNRIWLKAMATNPDRWSDELKTQLLALKPNRTIKEIAYAVRQSVDKIRQEAMATDPDEWSDELKTQLLALKTQLFGLEPDSTIEEIAEKVRQRRLWRQAEETDSDEWSDELKTQLLALKPGTISYEIATAASDELFISNVAGELVRTFFLDHQSPGKYSIVWDGRDDAGRERSNGVYHYSLKSDREANKRRRYRTILVR